jgi:hypothetical protein
VARVDLEAGEVADLGPDNRIIPYKNGKKELKSG